MRFQLQLWQLLALSAIILVVLLVATPSQSWLLNAVAWTGWGMCVASTIWVWRLRKE